MSILHSEPTHAWKLQLDVVDTLWRKKIITSAVSLWMAEVFFFFFPCCKSAVREWCECLLFSQADLQTQLVYCIKGASHESLDVRCHALSRLRKLLREKRVRCLGVCLSVCASLSVCLPVCACLSVFVCLCLTVCLSVCLSASLCLYALVCWPLWLFVISLLDCYGVTAH